MTKHIEVSRQQRVDWVIKYIKKLIAKPGNVYFAQRPNAPAVAAYVCACTCLDCPITRCIFYCRIVNHYRGSWTTKDVMPLNESPQVGNVYEPGLVMEYRKGQWDP